jgi:hypothetical protein
LHAISHIENPNLTKRKTLNKSDKFIDYNSKQIKKYYKLDKNIRNILNCNRKKILYNSLSKEIKIMQ